MQEVWKDIKGYEGLYQVSNLGNIKSSSSSQNLNPSLHSGGYLKIELYKNGKGKYFYVHRIVAEAFIRNQEAKAQVNHIDGNKKHNSVDNLEWATPSENISHAFKIGLLQSPMKGKYGNLNPLSKKIDQYSVEGKFINTWDSISDVVRHFDCARTSIYRCLRGETKTSMGYVWKYHID